MSENSGNWDIEGIAKEVHGRHLAGCGIMGWPSYMVGNTSNHLASIIHCEEKDFVEATFRHLVYTDALALVRRCGSCVHELWDIESDVSFLEQ
jgi:hypothetical protein